MKTGELDDPGLSFQEFSDRVDEQRERLPVDDEGAALSVLQGADSSSPVEREFETTTDDLYNARQVHESRSERAQAIDESQKAPITTDFDEWADNPDELDFPGIDSTKDIGPTF
ncbi:hypothetical protein CP557_02095 [Natrinema ejinorense]|uniref:Uncharacterized protein n=2 Tax=Natrinema ejinorense TaxID=373386 RepID=A0A2A5QRF4_9EURY|nr:hypothetical protein CP557_02095 [Natrinema ejinorense]